MVKAVDSPYEVPAFNPGPRKPREMFAFWGWHPNYPYWSKSCWAGATEEAAWESLASSHGSMDYYAVKLIKEEENGSFTVIADIPCKRLDVWQKIFDQTKKGT